MFSSTGPDPHSWAVSSDGAVGTWDVDAQTVSSSTAPSVTPADTRQKAADSIER